MCKFCYLSLLILLLATGVGVYKFIIQGSVIPASDGRTALLLTEGERDLVLTEMRSFLVAVQQIVSSAGNDDMSTTVEAARSVGLAAQTGMPASLIKKIPLEFKQLGFATHRKFDQLALDAEQLADSQHALQQLGDLMQNCISCHAAYRITTE